MKHAWKEIRYNLKKYLLIELLLVLMIFMVMFLSGLANGLGRAVSAGIENLNATHFLVSADSLNLITVSRLDEELLEEVKQITNNEAAALNIQRMRVNKKDDTETLNIVYFAVHTDDKLKPTVIKGDGLTPDTHTIVLDELFEEDGITVGDVLVDTSSGVELTVVGFTKDAMYGHIEAGYINMDTYKDIQTAINPGYSFKYNTIAVSEDGLASLVSEEIDVVEKDTIIKNLPSYQAEQLTINMILWVLVFVSGAILGVFFYIITLQKLKQFGVMKAIGMRMYEIVKVQLSQVMFLAGFGVFCGNALTFGMAMMLPKRMPFYLNYQELLIVNLVFVAIAVCSSIISVRQIAKVDPVKIIGGNEE